MFIRKAVLEDLDEIVKIFDKAKVFMAKTGNPNQWTDGYPKRSLIKSDIDKGICYVCIINDNTEGVFNVCEGENPTYKIIHEGNWLNSDPYVTIHRIASSGKYKGLLSECVNWCSYKYKNIRADTHSDNKIMQHSLTKNNFIRCGIIYLENGSPRRAYHREV